MELVALLSAFLGIRISDCNSSCRHVRCDTLFSAPYKLFGPMRSTHRVAGPAHLSPDPGSHDKCLYPGRGRPTERV